MTTPFDKYVQMYNGKLPTERDPDYLELLRMSKYRILAVPDVNMAKCANCGSTKDDGRKYIDFGLHVDWYGAVFLCGLCVKDIALNLGLFETLHSQIKEAHAQLHELNDLFTQGEDIKKTFLHTYEEVKEYFTQLHSSGIPIPTDTSDDVDSDKAATESGANQTESGTTEAKPRTTKSNSVSGRKDVPSLTSLLQAD